MSMFVVGDLRDGQLVLVIHNTRCHNHGVVHLNLIDGRLDLALAKPCLSVLLGSAVVYTHRARHTAAIWLRTFPLHAERLQRICFCDTQLAAWLLDPEREWSAALDAIRHSMPGRGLCPSGPFASQQPVQQQPVQSPMQTQSPHGKLATASPLAQLQSIQPTSTDAAVIAFAQEHKQAFERLFSALSRCGQAELYARLEAPFVWILAKMHCRGIQVNTSVLQAQAKQIKHCLRLLQQQAEAVVGGPMLMTSPVQLREYLYERLRLHEGIANFPLTPKGQLSTREDALQLIKDRHELPRILLLHRRASKLLTTYIDGVLPFVSAGCLHPEWHQVSFHSFKRGCAIKTDQPALSVTSHFLIACVCARACVCVRTDNDSKWSDFMPTAEFTERTSSCHCLAA